MQTGAYGFCAGWEDISASGASPERRCGFAWLGDAAETSAVGKAPQPVPGPGWTFPAEELLQNGASSHRKEEQPRQHPRGGGNGSENTDKPAPASRRAEFPKLGRSCHSLPPIPCARPRAQTLSQRPWRCLQPPWPSPAPRVPPSPREPGDAVTSCVWKRGAPQ